MRRDEPDTLCQYFSPQIEQRNFGVRNSTLSHLKIKSDYLVQASQQLSTFLYDHNRTTTMTSN